MMLKYLFLTAYFFALTGNSFGQTEAQRIKKQYGDHTLEIEYGENTIWMTVDQIEGFNDENNFQTLAFVAKWDGKVFKRNRAVNVDGERKVIDFVSSDTSILVFLPGTSFTNQGFFNAINVGKVTVYAIFDKTDTLAIDLVVNFVSIESVFGDQAIVDFIGKPDRITEKTIPYNTEETVDGLTYNTKDLLRGRRVIHWMYDKYPGAILVLNPVEYRDHTIVRQPAWVKLAEQLYFNF